MKTENKLEQVDQSKNQDNCIYSRALEKTCEGARLANEILHQHTYLLLATGMLAGLVTGYLVSLRCRCCSR